MDQGLYEAKFDLLSKGQSDVYATGIVLNLKLHVKHLLYMYCWLQGP
jgi:hypothetical protein